MAAPKRQGGRTALLMLALLIFCLLFFAWRSSLIIRVRWASAVCISALDGHPVKSNVHVPKSNVEVRLSHDAMTTAAPVHASLLITASPTTTAAPTIPPVTAAPTAAPTTTTQPPTTTSTAAPTNPPTTLAATTAPVTTAKPTQRAVANPKPTKTSPPVPSYIQGVVPEVMRPAENKTALFARDSASTAAKWYSVSELNDVAGRYDIVYTWVNGSDPVHLFRKAVATRAKLASVNARDREFGEFIASLRSIHQNMKWHRGRFVLISPGHVPPWLSLDSDRFSVVHQEALADLDIEKLTMNTNTIEPLLYRVPNVTEQYMQFNDDYFVAKRINADALFDVHGGGPILLLEPNIIGGGDALSREHMKKKTIWTWQASVFKTNGALDVQFGRKPRFCIKHAPFSMCRSVVEGVHAHWRNKYHEQATTNKVRFYDDILAPFMHHYVSLEGPDVAYKALIAENKTPKICPPALARVGPTTSATLLFISDKDTNVTAWGATVREDPDNLVAVNDALNNDKLVPQVAKFFREWFPTPSPFERDPQAAPTIVTGQPLVLVVSTTSCAASCAAIRSAASLGFIRHNPDATKIVIVHAEKSTVCHVCRGGRLDENYNTSYALSNATVSFATSHDEALGGASPEHLMLAALDAECAKNAQSVACGIVNGNQGNIVLVETTDPIFGEVVMGRHLRPIECGPQRKCFAVAVVPRTEPGEHFPPHSVVRIAEEHPGQSYLLTYPIPHPGSVFEIKMR